MPDDSSIQVTFGAQIQGLLDGLGKAQSSVKEATEGMSGSIAKMAETMAALGPATLGLAAVGLAFEGIKKSIEYVYESIDSTKELAEQFRTLEYATGASNAEMNQYTAAMEMTGGSTETLTGLMQGMVRGVKANAEGLVLNGMAADKAALQHMSFGEYLRKASEIADNMRTPLERDEFLTLAFGRAGAKAGAQLHELQENMEKVASTQILSPDVVVTMKALTEAEGHLKAAQQARAAQTAAMAAPFKIAYDNMKAAAIEWSIAIDQAAELAKKGMIQYQTTIDKITGEVVINYKAMNAAAKAYNEEAAKNANLGKQDAGREMQKAANAGGGQDYKDPKDKPAAVADPRIAAAKDAYEKTKILLEQEVADGRMTEREKTEALIEAVQVREKAELAAAGQTAAQKLQVTRQSENEIAQLGVTETNQQNAEVAKWSANYLAKQKEVTEAAAAAAKLMGDLAKEASREQVDAGKDALAAQKADLDQQVAFGQISSAQEIAQRKLLLEAEEKLVLDAKKAEIAALAKAANGPGATNNDVKAYQVAKDQELDLEREFQAKKKALDAEAAAKQRQTFNQVFEGMTSGFSTAISGLIKGTMSWGDALKSVANSALDSMINMFVQIGLKSAETWLANQIFATTAQQTQLTTAVTTNVSEGASSAALAAVNAFASTAAIPLIGPELAPEAAAAAYGQAMSWASMASAAGGWDRVPSDQVAQIHKNETVLSAPYAEGLRNIIKNQQTGGGNGSGGGGEVHNHFHAMDLKSFSKFINKSQNRGALLGMLGGAARNGRVS